MTVGLIADPKLPGQAVAQGKADFVAFGRAMIDDPRWPWHAAEALGVELRLPDQYGCAMGPKWRRLTSGG